jgi:transaldolase
VVERCDVINLLFFVHISALTFLFFYLICSKFSCMKFFIDTANLAHIKEANDLGILDGVTTNPSLMAKEGIKGEENILKHYADICALVDGDVSAEVLSTDFKTMVEEGKKLAAIHKNIVVKVPMIKDGIKAIKWFTDNGIRTNCTLVFSAGQAILAAKAGASYVSPFIGRVDDSNWDGILLIEQINHIYSIQGFDTQILAASIRNALHIVRSAEAGAHVCTCPLDSILGLLKHPLTDIGLAKFLEDAKKM